MLTETGDEALEAGSRAEARLDAADTRAAAAAYETGGWPISKAEGRARRRRSFAERAEAVPMPAREQK
jgi:hypothetical protein